MNLDDIDEPDFTSLRISNLTFSFGEVAILLLVKHSKISSTFQLSDLYDIMQIIQVLFTPISCNKKFSDIYKLLNYCFQIWLLTTCSIRHLQLRKYFRCKYRKTYTRF